MTTNTLLYIKLSADFVLCFSMSGIEQFWYASALLLGRFSNDDGDGDGDGNGNEDVKKPIGLLRKTTTLHVHHAFLYISLPSLHYYDVKMPNCKFYGGRIQATTTSFSLSKLECLHQEFNSREIRLHLRSAANWSKRNKVWKKGEFILKATFSLPFPSSMLKLLIACEQALLFGRAKRAARMGREKESLQLSLINCICTSPRRRELPLVEKWRSGNQSWFITGLKKEASLP